MKQIMEEYGLSFVFSVVGISFISAIIAFADRITVV